MMTLIEPDAVRQFLAGWLQPSTEITRLPGHNQNFLIDTGQERLILKLTPQAQNQESDTQAQLEDDIIAHLIEQQIGLTEGNIFHGELSLEQLLFQRPTAGWANYRTPVRNLWLCGSGAHPGGGIMGSPGELCAKELLKSGEV